MGKSFFFVISGEGIFAGPLKTKNLRLKNVPYFLLQLDKLPVSAGLFELKDPQTSKNPFTGTGSKHLGGRLPDLFRFPPMCSRCSGRNGLLEVETGT